MAKWQGKSLKKPSGGRRWPSRKKRKYELGRETVDTKVGSKKKSTVSARGKGTKSRLQSVDTVNITDRETGETKKGEVQSVLENPADPNLARRNIITKGAVIETEFGKARVTSRPGQVDSLDAILIEGELEEKEEIEEETEKEAKEESEEEEELEQPEKGEVEEEEEAEEQTPEEEEAEEQSKESPEDTSEEEGEE